MLLLLRSTAICFSIFCTLLVVTSYEWNKQVTLLNLERPRLIYANPNHIHVINITATRISRRDHAHYMQLCFDYLDDQDNNMTVNMDIQEFLSNKYVPSFVKWHLKFCQFLNITKFNAYHARNISEKLSPYTVKFTDDNCLLKKGIYYFANLTLPSINVPAFFPFEKGRVFISQTYKNKHTVVAAAIDLELKIMPKKRRN